MSAQSGAQCNVDEAKRSSCNDATGALDQTQCEARGCCFAEIPDSSYTSCWQPKQCELLTLYQSSLNIGPGALFRKLVLWGDNFGTIYNPRGTVWKIQIYLFSKQYIRGSV